MIFQNFIDEIVVNVSEFLEIPVLQIFGW
jgi:hypothetical protein